MTRAPRSQPRRGTLPKELTSFVGRRAELSAIRSALETARLVTLTGIGGVGKTRLALHAAARLRRGFPDGVWLVDLGEVSDPALVTDQVAAVLGVRDWSTTPLQETLADALSPHTMLLVLDTCEQVIEPVAELAQVLLSRCPQLRILATSRESLRIDGESVVRVAPLATPTPPYVPRSRELGTFESVTLFVERASASVPGFAITDDNRDVVARICTRLEGLPLAIELAAARLRVLSPAQILQRLTDRYDLLRRGSRGAPTRQQALRWSIDWSYDLCTPTEQQMWGRLSVCAGGVDLDAAEFVCGQNTGQPDLLDTLTALVDKSVLIREEALGEVRFRMLDTLREYGRATLEPLDALTLHRRQLDWYQRLTLAASAEWVSRRQQYWVSRLEQDLPNVREALEFALSQQDAAALRMAAALNPFWIARGRLSEGRRWLDRSLAQAQAEDGTSVERVRALCAACMLSAIQGDVTSASEYADNALVLDAQSSGRGLHALVAAAAGYTALADGDLKRARLSLADSVDTSRNLDRPSPQIYVLLLLGWTHQSSGETAEALAAYEEALAVADTHGESVYRSYALWAIGIALWRRGDTDRATHSLAETLRLARTVRDPLATAMCLQALAWIAAERHPRRAAVLMGAADALSHATGTPPVLFPNLSIYQVGCANAVCLALGKQAAQAACSEGGLLDLDDAVAFALDEQASEKADVAHHHTNLTKREHQVAEMVAKGLTNKAIAARLVLSKRTVDGHVEHVLTKLGFTSRAQIAVWSAEQERVPHVGP